MWEKVREPLRIPDEKTHSEPECKLSFFGDRTVWQKVPKQDHFGVRKCEWRKVGQTLAKSTQSSAALPSVAAANKKEMRGSLGDAATITVAR